MEKKTPLVRQPVRKKQKTVKRANKTNYDSKNVELITNGIVSCLLAGGVVFLLYRILIILFGNCQQG